MCDRTGMEKLADEVADVAYRRPTPRTRGTVTLPWIQVVMLQRAAGELLNLVKDNREYFFTTEPSEIDFEIARAERAIKKFDEVFRG